MSNTKMIKGTIRGRTFLKEFKFIWTISEARNIFDVDTGTCIYSPPIMDTDNLKWVIKLYPNGVYKTNKAYISIFIGLREKLKSSAYSELKLNLEVTFLNNLLGEESITKSKTLHLTPENNHNSPEFAGEAYEDKGWFQFLLKNNIQDNFENYLNEDDELKICCKIIKVYNNSSFENTCDTNNFTTREEIVCLKCNEMCNDFEKILNNEKLSDMKLQVNNVTFSVHKFMLAAKSPVFMSIIEKDPKLLIIEINDLNENVLKEMLRYMYIRKVENIEDIAVELLAAASKYQIKSLIKFCEEELIKSLNSTNLIDMLLTAEEYCAKNLKSEAIKMIVANVKDMMNSENWSKLSSNLITDILRLATS